MLIKAKQIVNAIIFFLGAVLLISARTRITERLTETLPYPPVTFSVVVLGWGIFLLLEYRNRGLFTYTYPPVMMFTGLFVLNDLIGILGFSESQLSFFALLLGIMNIALLIIELKIIFNKEKI